MFSFSNIFKSIFTLWGVVTLIFILFNLVPADPAKLLLGQQSNEETLKNVKKELGLNYSLANQYLLFLNDLSPVSVHSKNIDSYSFYKPEKQGTSFKLIDFKKNEIRLKKPYLRKSFQSKRNVTDILMDVLPGTFILAVSAMLLATILGIALGIISASFKDTFLDKSILFVGALGMAGPSFFMAILFSWIFAFVLGDFTGLNLSGSLYEIDELGESFYIEWKNLILPAFTLGIRPLSVITQLTRNSVLDTLSMDYIRTARAKGLSNFNILKNHVLRNSLSPIVTAVSGWFASLMAGAVFVEYIFGWKGIGKEMVEALENFDFPVVMGAVIIISSIFIFLNILVDYLYKAIDPRTAQQ